MAFIITAVLTAALVGAWVLRQTLIDNVYNTRSEWPTVSGTLLSTKKIAYSDSWGGFYDYIAIKFEYVVNGVTYQNSQKWYVCNYNKTKSLYPPGNSINVHYNPAEPGSGLTKISKSFPWWEWALRSFIVYGGLIALMIVILIWGRWVRGK